MDDGIAVGRRFVVVDLHLHRSVIAGLDEAGKQMGWVRIDNDPAAASCSTIAKEWLAAPPVLPRLPELKPTTTTAESTTPASKSCADGYACSTGASTSS